MRNISFALTTDQFLNGSKTVTRRLGWSRLGPGDVLMGCRKCQGLKPAEPLERLGPIRVVAVRRERLNAITPEDVAREGFPEMTPAEFVAMFREHMGCQSDELVTRIEFERLQVNGRPTMTDDGPMMAEDVREALHSWRDADSIRAACAAPDFDRAEKVHDWRNHVPTPLRDRWGTLSGEARLAVFLMAATVADDEEWD